MRILEILADPTHEEHQSIVEWLGPKFNPTTFSRIPIEKELGVLGTKIKGYEKGFQ